MKKPVLSIVATLLALLACCSPRSEEARIEKFVDRIGALAEKKDLSGLLALLADDYADFEGRDRAATEALLAHHFSGRYGIVVHLLHTEIGGVMPGGTATVDADVVLSSGGAEMLRKIIRFAGEFFKFKLDLRKTADGWKVGRAEWTRSSLNDIFPESLPVLRELFPGESEFVPAP